MELLIFHFSEVDHNTADGCPVKPVLESERFFYIVKLDNNESEDNNVLYIILNFIVFWKALNSIQRDGVWL